MSRLGHFAASPGDSHAYEHAADIVATLRPLRPGSRVVFTMLVVLALGGLAAWGWQLYKGLAVTAMNDYFSWGVYIINFVFFIGISMAGTLISAILRLTGAEWRRPITRMAEGITLFALLVAGPMIIIDMGRPDRFLYVFQHGRVQSPILWDVASLTTYLAGSILYLYLPLIPDMAILRDHPQDYPRWRQRLYRVLALGWHGSAEQERRLEKAIAIIAIAIIPVAISIHTVTAWIFGMTLRPGWHSTIIGPDFVVGALYSGIAAVITAMAAFRKFFLLHRHITEQHFRYLATMLLVVGLLYLYFTVNEYVGTSYVGGGVEANLIGSIFEGSYAVQFWTMASIGLIVPCILLILPWTRTLRGIVIASILVNVGMWLMRYIIIIPTLSVPYLPPPAGVHFAYVPTWVEWAITVGGICAFASMYILFSKIFPIVSIWELPPEPAVPGGKP